MEMQAKQSAVQSQLVSRRWFILFLGAVAMMAISSPQYVWTLFVPSYREELAVSLTALQVTIAILSIGQNGLGPLHGWIVARTSTTIAAMIGAAMVGASWALSANVTSVVQLYITYGVLSGVGAGLVYVATLDVVTAWFPDRRGFAIGIVTGSYGFGAIFTTFPISNSISAIGFRDTLTLFAGILAVVCFLAALGLKKPKDDNHEIAADPLGGEDEIGPREMLRTPVFWTLFGMMVMVGTGGLMMIAQLSVIAEDFGIGPEVTVFGLAALPLALTLDRVANGLTRPVFGWISDRIGREKTMLIAFTAEGVAIALLMLVGSNPLMFVILSGLVFFGWGEIFSLFPAIQADIFGKKHAARNVGFLLVAIGLCSIIGGPFAAFLHDATGSWIPVFSLVIFFDFTAATLAVTLLPRLRRSYQFNRATSGRSA